jgi:capsular polysaccharide biosynthesis protein
MRFSPTTTDSPAPSLDEPEPLSYRVFEPPSGLVLTAIARNKLIVFVCAVVIAVAGTGYELARSPTFTASSTLQVGQVNPNSPGFYSYVESAAALATAFARAISAEPVLAVVKQKLNLSPAQANARLSAEPIPQSPVFRVIGTGPTESAAIQLTNVTANAMIAYESQTNSANPEAASLLHEYSAASLALEHADAKLSELEASTREARARTKQGHTAASTFAPDKAARDTAQAKLKAIAAAYTAAVTSQAPRSGLISLLAGATSATTDRRSKIEELGFIGLLVGVVLGCVIAVLRERRRIRRRTASMEVKVQEPAQV